MYAYEIKLNLQKTLNKLFKKDKVTYEQVLKKIEEVIDSSDVEHYKNLKYDLKEFKRVHVGSFVLVFKIDKNKNLVSFEDFEHHNKIYK